MFSGNNTGVLFLTPIDSNYNDDNSERNSEEERDIIFSNESDKFVNELLRDFDDDSINNKAYSVKLNDSTFDTKCDKNSVWESFDSFEFTLNLKDEDKMKVSKVLKDDWRTRINIYNKNSLNFLMGGILNNQEGIGFSMNYNRNMMVSRRNSLSTYPFKFTSPSLLSGRSLEKGHNKERLSVGSSSFNSKGKMKKPKIIKKKSFNL